MDKFKVGIIGCGGIHKVHAEILNKLENTELVAVCDIVPDRAAASAKAYGVPSYCTDYMDIINDPKIQSVHLCVPHYLHAPMAIAAMQAGKAVLTEKPLATSLSDAERILAVQKKTGAHTGVCFQNRYRRLVQKLNSMIENGELGEIYGGRAFINWCRNEEYFTASGWRGSWKTEGGSLLINQCIHTLDLLQWMLGGVKQVNGMIGHHFFGNVIETEDTAELRLTMNSGIDMLFYATTGYCEDSFVLIDIVAEKAHVRLEDDLYVTWNNGAKETFEENHATGEKAYWGNTHINLISDFYDKLQKGEPFNISVEEGLKTIRILDAAYTNPNINKTRW